MNIVVQDTNIFIDLFNGNILNRLPALPIKFIITDFIFDELKTPSELVSQIAALIADGTIIVKVFDEQEMDALLAYTDLLEDRGNLSLQDISVLYVAKIENRTLITNEKKLRSTAQKEHVEVKGLFHIFDLLVPVLGNDLAKKALTEISNKNRRLPKDQIQKRLENL